MAAGVTGASGAARSRIMASWRVAQRQHHQQAAGKLFSVSSQSRQ